MFLGAPGGVLGESWGVQGGTGKGQGLQGRARGEGQGPRNRGTGVLNSVLGQACAEDSGGPVGDLSGTSEGPLRDVCGNSGGPPPWRSPDLPRGRAEVPQSRHRGRAEVAQRSRTGRTEVAQRSRTHACNNVQHCATTWCAMVSLKRVRQHTCMQVSLPRKCVGMFRNVVTACDIQRASPIR